MRNAGRKWKQMRKRIAIIVISLAFLLSSTGMAERKEKVCWPLHFAGITLGITTDPEVTRLIGNGVFRKDEGDAGGRVFVDKNHTATLHTVSFTDQVVGEVTVSSGVAGLSESELSMAETSFFDPNYGFGNWHALKLGSTQSEVVKNLGEPAEKNKQSGWVYYTACACEIPECFTIYFTNGRVTKVVFGAG
jgi:hypothetical protein